MGHNPLDRSLRGFTVSPNLNMPLKVVAQIGTEPRLEFSSPVAAAAASRTRHHLTLEGRVDIAGDLVERLLHSGLPLRLAPSFRYVS
jgi:hypothetical protein